jgi:Cu(I)/Ag(I) efflux system membrane fusion protein
MNFQKPHQSKNRHHLQVMASCGLVVLILAGLAACSKPASHSIAAEVDYWTCAMHPEVHSKTPGKCPICGMDLAPMMSQQSRGTGSKKTAQQGDSQAMTRQSPGRRELSELGDNPLQSDMRKFTVPIQRQQQIGVTYAEARRRHMRLDIRSVGTLEVDQTQVFECVTGVDGFIEELRVASPGERVTVGQPLMAINTPDLRSAEQELVNVLKVHESGSVPAESIDQVIDFARRRLQLLKVSPNEISELERTLQPTDHFLLRSFFDGVVSEAPMKVGTSVKRGDKLMTILNLSRLWLWASFYENEIGLLQEGQTVRISLPAFPSHSSEGKIGAIGPAVDSAKRTAKVRIDIPNPDGQLRPGMYANVVAEIDAGEVLTIPFDSVLPTGSRMLVFVGSGSGRLEPRFVQVGRQFVEFGDSNQERYYQIIGGLQEGERVVSSANFLIDAEAQIQGALKDFRDDTTITGAGK